MLRLVALVRTNVSEGLNASFIRVTRIGELGTTLAVTSNGSTLRRNKMIQRRDGHFRLEGEAGPLPLTSNTMDSQTTELSTSREATS
jgi:hypothetical protein